MNANTTFINDRDVLMNALAAMLRSIVVDAVQDAVSELEPEPRPALLNRQQLARELGCSTATIAKLERQGLPRLLLGESPRYELEPVLVLAANTNPIGAAQGTPVAPHGGDLQPEPLLLECSRFYAERLRSDDQIPMGLAPSARCHGLGGPIGLAWGLPC